MLVNVFYLIPIHYIWPINELLITKTLKLSLGEKKKKRNIKQETAATSSVRGNTISCINI